MEKNMYRAELEQNGTLIILEVAPSFYNRYGFSDLGKTKDDAVDKLRQRVAEKYKLDLKRIDFQREQLCA